MSATLLSLSTIESALARCLVQALWQDALLGLTAALVLAMTARRSAATRHAIGLGFLVAMVVVPAWELAGLLAGVGSSSAGLFGLNAALIFHMPAGGLLLPADALGASFGFASPAWLAGLWAGGVLLMFVRLAGGGWLLRSLARQPFAPLPSAWAARAEALRSALGIVRPVTVKLLDAIEQPFSSRAWRPVIWLPVSMLTRLAPDQIEALLAHELAHIRRLDWIWNGLQCAIEALLFFHPVVWWLSHRIRQEREHACDDLAVAVCGDAIVVAEALAALESLRRPLPRLALAADGGALTQRIRRLLGADRPRRARWRVAAGLAILACAGGLLAPHGSIAAESLATTNQAAQPISREPWWTYVGDSVRIKRIENGRELDYHSWTDIGGNPHETYRVDGQPAPIDTAARQWIAEHHKLPAPPASVSPPAPTGLAGTPAFKALEQQLQHEEQAVALLGSPIAFDQDCHRCRVDDDNATLHLTVHGPKGSAQLDAEGTLINGQWHYPKLQLKSA